MKFLRTRTLGFHKNNKRLWLTPRIVEDAGFKGNDVIYFDFTHHCDTPTLNISKKPAKDSVKGKVTDAARGGLIDINNKALTEHFSRYEEVTLEITPKGIKVTGSHHESLIEEREYSLKRRVSTRQSIRKGGLFAGLGLLCRSTHRGLKAAGVKVTQKFSNDNAEMASEINVGGNEIWDEADSDAVFSHEDIYKMDMRKVPKLDFVVMGSPCPPFSQVNTKLIKSGKTDIFHPEYGTIFQPILSFIKASNPAVVLLENSRNFKDSTFDYIMSDIMERMGYNKIDTIVTGRQFGAFEMRQRLCRVWISNGLGIPDINALVKFEKENERTVSEILEPMDNESKNWGKRTYLEAKSAESHNGHNYCLVKMDDKVLPVMGANYHKIQPDSPQIPHPLKDGYSRILTPSEHCNTRNISGKLKKEIVELSEGTHPSKLNTRTSAGTAHKMLGNSVTPEAWEAVSEWLGEWFNEISGCTVNKQENKRRVFGDQLGLSFVV